MILDNFHYGVCACVALFLLIMIVKSVLVEPSEPTCSSKVTECSVEVKRRFHGDRGELQQKRRKLCHHDHASHMFLDDGGDCLIDSVHYRQCGTACGLATTIVHFIPRQLTPYRSITAESLTLGTPKHWKEQYIACRVLVSVI